MRAACLLVLCSLLFTSSASAITWGEPDQEDHPYVGLIVTDFGAGFLLRCTATLIAPRVVLTAAHCTYGAQAARVWFETDLSEVTDYPYGGGTGIEGTPVTHPNYPGYVALPNTYDVAIVLLDEPVTDRGFGVPMPKGVLDELDTRRGRQDTLFTPVGYGLQSVIPELSADLVRYRATSMLVNLRSALTDGYNIHLSNNAGEGNGAGGTCYGDSGGPIFLTTRISSPASIPLA